MSENKKKLAKNSFIYASFTLLQKGFAFFLIPLYTTKLSTEEYGILGIVMAAIPFFVLLASLSIRGSTAYFYYEFKDKDPGRYKAIWRTSFTIVVLFSFFFTGLLWICKEWLITVIFKGIDFYPFIFLALLSVCTQPIYFYYQSMLKAKQEARKAALLDFVYFFIIISLTIILILFFNFKAEGALLAFAVANGLFFFYSIYAIFKEVSFGITRSLLKPILKYSLPILPHNLSAWAMNLADRVILNSITTLSLVGLFDIGAQLGKLINIITLGVNSAYSPWFFEQVKSNEKHKTTIAGITEKMVLVYIIVGIAISWFSPELLVFISNDAYQKAWIVVPFIAFAFVINGFYYSFSNVFFLEKTKYLPIITLIGAIVNIAFNFALIPAYGIMGAAIAALSSKIVFVIIAYRMSQKLFFIPYNLRKMMIWYCLGLLASWLPFMVQYRIEEYHIGLIVLLKLLCFLILIMPLIWNNKAVIQAYIKNRRS